jgi:hypothetical protein
MVFLWLHGASQLLFVGISAVSTDPRILSLDHLSCVSEDYPCFEARFFSETSLLCGSLNRTTLIVIAILVHHALFFATSNHPVMSGWLQHVTAILEIKCKYWVHSTTLRLLQSNLGNGFEDRICNYGIWFNTSGVPGKNAVVLQLQEHDRPILNDDMGLWHF